jgi:hypothetical protein
MEKHLDQRALPMTSQVIHDMTTPWVSSDTAALEVTVQTQPFLDREATANRLRRGAMTGAVAEFAPAAPLDLSGFDELRVWIRASRPADGSRGAPFYLALWYRDTQDVPSYEHRWFIPVNASAIWEQRRIGIEGDRRGSIDRFRFEALGAVPFTVDIFQLLAVRERMLPDLEQALVDVMDGLELPDLVHVPIAAAAHPGDHSIEVTPNPGFEVGNRVRLDGGTAGAETHEISQVQTDPATNRTTLQFPPGDQIIGDLTPGTAFASVVVPVLVEAPPTVGPTPVPRVAVTNIDAREDQGRSGYATQRDSFRPRGPQTVCSVRPAARAYTVDYQITTVAHTRDQQALIHNGLLGRLSADFGLWVNGAVAPVWILPPPALLERKPGLLAPLYLRVGSRMEVSPRREQTWVRQAEVRTGRIDLPTDEEGTVMRL